MKYFLILPFLMILISCNRENPAHKELKVYSNATLTTEYPYVSEGDNLVFSYYYVAEDDKDIIDDEFSEDFFFEIVPDGDSFSLSVEDLAFVNFPFEYIQYCFCIHIDKQSITSFKLAGTKESNGNWKIEGEVTLLLEDINEETEEVEFAFEKELILSGTYGLSAFH